MASLTDKEMVSAMVVPKGGTRGRMLGEGQLVKFHRTRDMDSATGILTCETYMIPITPEEFDEMKARIPNFRPYSAAIGDNRSGRQLLNDYAKDAAWSLQRMLSSAKGRQQLQKVAERTGQMCRPTIVAAKQITDSSQPPSTQTQEPLSLSGTSAWASTPDSLTPPIEELWAFDEPRFPSPQPDSLFPNHVHSGNYHSSPQAIRTCAPQPLDQSSPGATHPPVHNSLGNFATQPTDSPDPGPLPQPYLQQPCCSPYAHICNQDATGTASPSSSEYPCQSLPHLCHTHPTCREPTMEHHQHSVSPSELASDHTTPPLPLSCEQLDPDRAEETEAQGLGRDEQMALDLSVHLPAPGNHCLGSEDINTHPPALHTQHSGLGAEGTDWMENFSFVEEHHVSLSLPSGDEPGSGGLLEELLSEVRSLDSDPTHLKPGSLDTDLLDSLSGPST
mmetsp:Transcript_30999/g.48576  ORF Transcript_30999/g.48576 Transcript_30999/m.48576 type:complete len:447 (+) Transcript_30999:176-1516(+)